MNFEYNETQAMIAQSIREFAEKEIRPNIMKWDEDQIFPVELFKKLGEMGFMGVLVPEELGGSGLGYHEYITVVEEISKWILRSGCLLQHTIHCVPIIY